MTEHAKRSSTALDICRPITKKKNPILGESYKAKNVV